MTSFDEVWNTIQKNLRPGLNVKNWTVPKGYFGTDIKIVKVSQNFIDVDSPTAINIQRVQRNEFEEIWKIWIAYKTQKIRRSEMVVSNRHTRYIINILRWYDLKEM